LLRALPPFPTRRSSDLYCSPTAGSLDTGRPYCARAGAAVARIIRITPASHRAEGTQTLRMVVFSAPDALNITAGLHAGSLGRNRSEERRVGKEGGSGVG